MSQRLSWFVLLLMVLAIPVQVRAQEASELKINSTRYVVIDAATGNIFAQRGANDRVAIASLTKVFTAVQALEMAPLDAAITTSDDDLRTPDGGYFGTNGTLMGFEAGEEYTLEDMLYGMLLPSGNDAANAIARNLGGLDGAKGAEATQHFMDLLNQRVDDMGLKNTHLMNPHGWGVDGHYSSAADVAAFNRLVMNYPILLEIMGTHSYTTGNGAITVANTNKSLQLFDSVIAGKTGYDWDSGYCLVNIATREEVRMIAVTLDGVAPDDWYDDNATLLDYGFDEAETLAGSGKPFEGDVAAYIDPSAAEVSRSVESTGGFTSKADSDQETAAPTSVVATEDDPLAGSAAPDPVLEAEEDTSPIQLADRGVWGVVAAVSILLVRGALSMGGLALRRHRSASTGDARTEPQRGSADAATPAGVE